VRITCIYEGTSEIMEMTIGRDRWQLHLKSRGQHYHDRARELEALAARHPEIGAQAAALALHALADAMERARADRLTRFQHVLLRLGEWIAYAECGAALARRAARAAEGRLHEKASLRFDAAALAAISRVFARDAALRVAQEGARWTGAAANPAALQIQAGLLADMDSIADVLYTRTGTAAHPTVRAVSTLVSTPGS
jgi:acyl-CoA dehydrogenase